MRGRREMKKGSKKGGRGTKKQNKRPPPPKKKQQNNPRTNKQAKTTKTNGCSRTVDNLLETAAR